jgi:hypothetical protein
VRTVFTVSTTHCGGRLDGFLVLYSVIVADQVLKPYGQLPYCAANGLPALPVIYELKSGGNSHLALQCTAVVVGYVRPASKMMPILGTAPEQQHQTKNRL